MKLPWEKDPNDREANYQRPVPRAETFRLATKAAIAVAAALAFRVSILDRSHEGAKLVIALGLAVGGAGIVDLVYMRRHELEQIFLKSARQQRVVRAAMVLVGLTLVTLGTLAYAA